MAELTFVLYDTEKRKITAERILSYEWTKDADAVCDGLRLRLMMEALPAEVDRVEIYCGGVKAFNGYCDTQRESVSSEGFEVFLYARSSACILLDNEAKPCTYNSPSARSLYLGNAAPLGFGYALPTLYCESDYRVGKGTSCYAAVNDFVYGITGKNILVNAQDELTLADRSETVSISAEDVISERRIINRGSIVARIDYKIDGESDYIYHIKSRFFDDLKLRNSRKLNLSSLPEWQRNHTLSNLLRAAGEDYRCREITLNGLHPFALYSGVAYRSPTFGNTEEDDYISSVCITMNESGVQTRVKINKNIDLKEITYVAE